MSNEYMGTPVCNPYLPDPRDAELARLRGEVERLTRELQRYGSDAVWDYPQGSIVDGLKATLGKCDRERTQALVERNAANKIVEACKAWLVYEKKCCEELDYPEATEADDAELQLCQSEVGLLDAILAAQKPGEET